MKSQLLPLLLLCSLRLPQAASESVYWICDTEYQVIGRLGKGGFGNVYKALDMKTGELVALKTIEIKNEKYQRYFKREVGAMAAMKGEKHAVQIICSHAGPKQSIIVMEYCNDGDLSSRNFPKEKVLDLWSQMAEGLQAIHRRGLVHGDIKPANVFLHDDVLKIGDFGLAVTEKVATQSGVLGGTKKYMAPEILTSIPNLGDRQVDLWAAGVSFYEIFTGKHPYLMIPFPAKTRSELQSNLRWFIWTKKIRLETLDPEMGPILYRLLHKRPDARSID